jgi:hypothetical protein
MYITIILYIKGTKKMTNKKYAYKGTNEDHDTCLVCGRSGLKKVMWLVELDPDGGEIGEAFAVGTSCGPTLLGYTQRAFNKAIKSATAEIANKKRFAYYNHPLYREALQIRKELQKTLSGRELRRSSEFLETKILLRQARQEAHSIEFKSDL